MADGKALPKPTRPPKLRYRRFSGLKRGKVRLRRSKLKKVSKAKISTIQNKIWQLCKKIIRLVYPNVCYTCGATGLSGLNCQTGHVPWPKAALGAFLKYSLKILRLQCFNCNINRGGMGAEAYKKMLKEIGEEKMAELERDRQKEVKAYDHYVKVLLAYEKLWITLQESDKTLYPVLMAQTLSELDKTSQFSQENTPS